MKLLTIEDAKPCKWCDDSVLGRVTRFIPYDTGKGHTEYKEEVAFRKDWELCPICGRSLT